MPDRIIQVGHSPDADDAFMFHALSCGAVSVPGLQFEHVLADIQTLNEWARNGRLDVTAISVHALAHVADRYAVLTHGASMGDGYGPLVVSRDPAMRPEKLPRVNIAIPGTMTSAFLALSICCPGFHWVAMHFDAILPAVVRGDVDAGLLIHEGQLTHPQFGLHPVLDLGAWWKQQTGLPLPLGVNVIRRDLEPELQRKVSRALHDSVEYGLTHREDALKYAMQYGRGVDTETADLFVSMYVNDWTLNMGDTGKRAIRLFLQRGAELGLTPADVDLAFVGVD